jgi:N-acetylglucosamine-6-phosphate deacetylase
MTPLDIQVNGFGGVDFNSDDLTAEQLHQSMQSLRQHGAGQILATFITADLTLMRQRMERLATLRESDTLAREIIVGIHVEGPFINPETGYVGAHPPEAVRPARVEDMKPLLDAGRGLVKLVTLAPECDAGFALTSFLAGNGIRVAAGHTAATREQLLGAADGGLTIFTHVGNGCPASLPRHDNIVNRALSLADRLWLSFIPDGVHIPFFVLKNYLRCAGADRSIMVTDAISAAGMGPGVYPLSKSSVRVGEDLVARTPDGVYLAGSTVTQNRMAENLQRELGVNEGDLERMTVENPRTALGLN